MSEELKLCPFCGGKALVCETEVDGERVFMVACDNCGISTAASSNEADVIDAWNKRVS